MRRGRGRAATLPPPADRATARMLFQSWRRSVSSACVEGGRHGRAPRRACAQDLPLSVIAARRIRGDGAGREQKIAARGMVVLEDAALAAFDEAFRRGLGIDAIELLGERLVHELVARGALRRGPRRGFRSGVWPGGRCRRGCRRAGDRRLHRSRRGAAPADDGRRQDELRCSAEGLGVRRRSTSVHDGPRIVEARRRDHGRLVRQPQVRRTPRLPAQNGVSGFGT
jgi:hypothetical protein